jgi:hypothetical protein
MPVFLQASEAVSRSIDRHKAAWNAFREPVRTSGRWTSGIMDGVLELEHKRASLTQAPRGKGRQANLK